MKLPTLRTPKPPAGSRWKVAAAVNVDLPGIPSYSPKVGDELRFDHPFVQFCFEHNAVHLLVPADASSDELAAAYARNLFPADMPPPTPDPSIQVPGPLPDERRMVCTKALFVGNAAIPAGTIVDLHDQFVKAYPQNFAPAGPAVSE
jgi:hypothetical protein